MINLNIIEIILVSIAAASDAFAVSICKGLMIEKLNIKDTIKIALWFGIFQSLMPTIGYFLGNTFEMFIIKIDHWIAFILLSIIGINMIKEKDELKSYNSIINFRTMFLSAIATSIDALVIGIAYVCVYQSTNACLTFSMIGIITFILSCIGVIIGNKFGNKYNGKASIVGGVILIVLGIKILLSHLL